MRKHVYIWNLLVHFFNCSIFVHLELNLRQGEEVLIIGIKSGDLWLPVSPVKVVFC